MQDYQNKDYETLTKWFNSRLYMVDLKQKDNLSESYLRVHGVLTTGDRRLDNEMYSARVSVYKKIPELMLLFESGVELRFPDQKQCAEIYNLSNAVLLRLMEGITSGVNLKMYNVEWVRKLDDFLKNIFPLAAPYIPKPSQTDLFASYRLSPDPIVETERKVREHACVGEMIDLVVFGTEVNGGKKKQIDDYDPYSY